MSKGKSRLKATVVTQRPRELGPKDGQRKTPPSKPPRLHRPLKSSIPNMEHREHVNGTGPDNLEPREAEPKTEILEEIGVGWGLEVHASFRGGMSARHTRSTHRSFCAKTDFRPPICWTAGQRTS